MSDCAVCGFTILDTAYACRSCALRTADQLMRAAELYHELATQIARQTCYGDRVRLNGAEPPIPFSVKAMIDTGSVDNTLVVWAQYVVRERGTAAPVLGAGLCVWLAEQTDWLRYRVEAAQGLDELSYAARLVERAIDAPGQRWYAGSCAQCDADLYGHACAQRLRCKQCGAEYVADDRRQWLLGLAADRLGTAVEVARFCSAMRLESVTTAMIRGYVHRGRLVTRGEDRQGRALFRVGDVLGALA